MIDYLTSKDMQLSQAQLEKIEQMLNSNSTQPTITQTTDQHQIASTLQNLTEMNKQISIYTCSKSNTYITHLFNPNVSQKIISILQNKIPWIIFFIGFFTYLIWSTIENGDWSIAILIYRVIFLFSTIIFGIFISLVTNRKMIRVIAKQFAFWFKMLTIIQWSVSWLWIRYVSTKVTSHPLEIVEDVLLQIVIFLGVANVSVSDAHQNSRRMKICLGIFLSMSFSIAAVAITFIIHQDVGAAATIHISDKLAVDLVSTNIGAMQVLSIFFWKQTIFTIKKKDKCVTIKNSPYLEWTD